MASGSFDSLRSLRMTNERQKQIPFGNDKQRETSNGK